MFPKNVEKSLQTLAHCLSLRDLSVEQITALLSLSQTIKKDPTSFQTALKGKTVLQFFLENSTRTRLSFETAVRKLGGTNVGFTASASSFAKGESLIDTVNTLKQYGADAIVMRHSSSGSPKWVHEFSDLPVVNAGDGQHEHPTQALLDAYTLGEFWGIDFTKSDETPFAGKRVAILGDILHSRVARSNIHGLTKLGAHVVLCAPQTLLPHDLSLFPKIETTYHLDPLLESLDAIICLRMQLERQHVALVPSAHEYRHFWGLTPERARKLRKNAPILHPGPMNRGLEIDAEVADSAQSLILKQVENGVFVRMAVLSGVLAK
jgi:aspartate carbamoyltransferase catalytic subunit